MIVASFKKHLLVFILCWSCIDLNAQITHDFGTRSRISDGLEGKIYALPEYTRALPDFDTMSSLGTIYTKELNIPRRSWTNGFPGVTDRFEWFGIEYNATFKVKKEGEYTFILLSDDGSKLFIDDSLVIDNDGLHAQVEKSNLFYLDKSTHKIKIQYFQGPRTDIALQLFVRLDSIEVFPGNNFVLTTPEAGDGKNYYVLVLIGVFVLLLVVWWYRKKRKKSASFNFPPPPYKTSPRTKKSLHNK